MKNLDRFIIYPLAVLLAFLLFKSCDRTNTLKNLHEAVNDTLTQTRNKLGQQITTIAELTAERKKDFLKLNSSDSTIKWLQSEVKNYKGKLKAATVASTQTTDSGKTITVIKTDTVYINGKPELKPVYSSAWNETWSVGIIESHYDSIHRNIKIRNEYVFTHGYKRNLFKKDMLKVEMKNLNPNTVTTELRSYSVATPSRRFGIGIGAAYGFDMINIGRTTVVVGVTANYTIIKF